GIPTPPIGAGLLRRVPIESRVFTGPEGARRHGSGSGLGRGQSRTRIAGVVHWQIFLFAGGTWRRRNRARPPLELLTRAQEIPSPFCIGFVARVPSKQ